MIFVLMVDQVNKYYNFVVIDEATMKLHFHSVLGVIMALLMGGNIKFSNSVFHTCVGLTLKQAGIKPDGTGYAQIAPELKQKLKKQLLLLKLIYVVFFLCVIYTASVITIFYFFIDFTYEQYVNLIMSGCIVFLLCTVLSFAQSNKIRTKIDDYYLKKDKPI